MKNFKSLSIIVLVSLFMFGCKTAKDSVIQLGKDSVTVNEFKARMQETSYYYSKDFIDTPQGKKQILDGLLKETIMLSAARDKGLDKTEEFQIQLKTFTRQAIITSLVKELRQNELNVTEEEVEALYEKDKAYYENPYKLIVSHILFSDQAAAEAALKELEAGVAFEVLASSASIDQASAKKGGVLPAFGKGDMVPAFEEVAFSLKNNGDISELVKTTFGFHIIKRLNQEMIDPISFEASKNKLRRILEKQKFDTWYESVQAKKVVKVNESKIADITLK
ncbi:MAG: hypothetical protein GY817_05635 [bacterium]|nr:hypothetical protein [bacterium]